MIFRFKTFGGKSMGGPLYDTADDIFAGAVDDYAKLGTTGGGDEGVEPEKTEPENQDVDQTGQGKEKEGTPETPDKSADDSTKEKEGETDEKEKKVDGVAEVRKWGQGWEKTAKDHEKKIAGYEPTIKFVDEKFGGQAGMELAAQIYEAVANEADFNPVNAVEFLSENLPEVADKLVTYIAQNVAEQASSTTLERTFGRKLNEQDITDVRAFLAAGKPKDASKLDSFLKAENIPDELRYDSEGNERDPQILDFLHRQQKALNETQAQLKELGGQVKGAESERQQQLAAEAIEGYVTETFGGVARKVTELGLDKAIEGETPEIAGLRKDYANAIEAIVLFKASQDPEFQAMYRGAVTAVAKLAASPKDALAKAKKVDYSRRLSARVEEMSAEAAEFISPLIESFTAKRTEQIDKINKTKPEPITPGVHKEKQKERDPNEDPFDSESIQAEVQDIMRANKARRQ